MATLSGKEGKVEYSGGKVASIRNWSLTADANMLDHTVMSTGTVQWRTFKAGLSQWSGSVGDLSDAASTGQTDMRTNFLTPTTAQIILYEDKGGGSNWRGSAFISSINASANVDADVNATYNFQGTGALSYSTST